VRLETGAAFVTLIVITKKSDFILLINVAYCQDNLCYFEVTAGAVSNSTNDWIYIVR